MLKKVQARKRRHVRVRKRITGSADRPRLTVFRSNKHIYAQLIDDRTGQTVAAASTLDEGIEKAAKAEAARNVGLLLGKRAKDSGVEAVVFDRGGYKFHGRVAKLAEGAREAGLKF